ncbi:Fic/DOC family protein [Treponema berlinense]|uniref:Fic/DOC family protein n=1 Tax=Treponema berlinense TaxID=225004 RepID=A0A1T4PPM0_9SPIR|nr:Fic family protein [Treponema berlinense]SJZ93545.1 Fic/DOC family protein [Treponema berlinense]
MSKIYYISVEEAAQNWQISERSVRNYCAHGRVEGALLEGKIWKIPSTAQKPERKPRHSSAEETLLTFLKREKEAGLKGGIYHKIQIDLTYNSNHIEGSNLTHDQTRYIFETKTLGVTDKAVKVDDIVETVNHFRCIDLIIEGAHTKLTESFIKQLHFILKSGTTDSQKSWFRVGDYKMLENEVGGSETTKPVEVAGAIKSLLKEYNSKTKITFDDILDFHVRFESIHPFQDGNGRVGRLIMFKECLKHNIVPFIITEELKMYYYRGIKNWKTERVYLRDTCLTGQDAMKAILDYFGIKYE